MSSPPPYAIVVLSAGDPRVMEGAARVARKLFTRHQANVQPVPLESAALRHTLAQLAGGTLYLVGHGDEWTVGDRAPANLAIRLYENGLPATVARIHVMTCLSGVAPPELLEAPALRLRGNLMALYRAPTNFRVTGLTGKSADFGGSFRTIPAHPVITWLDAFRDAVHDPQQMGTLLDAADDLDPDNRGMDAFTTFVEAHDSLRELDEEESQIYDAIQMLITRLHDKNARPDVWLVLYMLVQQLGDVLQDGELTPQDQQESALSSLDMLEPLILQALALSRQASKVTW
ncbi:hypothetical protein [Corallococcus llansteffanensis]|uniref:Uncharacterized protein n=1 Tax=Corallococcus llansteffanensis TaxID=2316731 RepID=A0A3A8NLB5_9BACT|nr:hypothetical protein [Corallococcus llansteffanensis]RKH40752.1 hypothetical protein D7V93_39295 [Corallococcus llansteffanensis]